MQVSLIFYYVSEKRADNFVHNSWNSDTNYMWFYFIPISKQCVT